MTAGPAAGAALGVAPAPADLAPPPADREDLIADLLSEMGGWRGRDHRGAFEAWLRRSMSVPQLFVLAVLDSQGPTPMGHLADILDVSVASTTGIVSRMESRGLVRRERGTTDDLRIVLVARTDEGRRVFDELGAQRAERLRRLLGELTPDELSGLLTGMRGLHAARERLAAREHPVTAGDGPHRPTGAPA